MKPAQAILLPLVFTIFASCGGGIDSTGGVSYPPGEQAYDAGMLPPESIRFFHVDAGWIRAAVDGALSVGVGHALDADLNDLART